MIRAVLFDRDGTLVENVPYNGDPELVSLRPGAVEAVAVLRSAGFALGVVTNQSAIGRGLITVADADRVRDRIVADLGSFGTWQTCPHAPWQLCECRKPRAGLIRAAAGELGVSARECCVVGDSDVDYLAAAAAGSSAILVPTSQTSTSVMQGAPRVAGGLLEAAGVIVGTRTGACADA